VINTDERTGLHLNGATIMTTPTDRQLAIARQAGFAGVEVRAERLLGADGELRATANVVLPGEVWSLNGLQLKVDATGRLRRDLLDEELPPRLAICRALGARYLLVVPPRIPGVAVDAAVAGVADGLARARDAAARDSIGVAFEFLGFADCPIDTPELAARVADRVPGADLVIDSCHWHASGSRALASFPIDRLAMVHLNDAPAKPPRDIEDADRVLPTRGVIALGDLVGQLAQAAYRGPWSLETFNPGYWNADPVDIAAEGYRLTAGVLGELR
jgi:2-keto-myo-inositol isomerase